LLPWIQRPAPGTLVKIAAKIATICEKTFARLYPSNVSDIAVKMPLSMSGMNASVNAVERGIIPTVRAGVC